IEVVDSAPDPLVAREKIKQLNPDVLTLDVEMPRMDGLTFLRNLMRLRPMPVVMVSTLTEHGADVTLEALELGAVDFVSKPKVDVVHGMDQCAAELIAKVKIAAKAKVHALLRPDAPGGAPPTVAKAPPPPRHNGRVIGEERIIAIGASTGGTEAIKEVLMALQPDSPGIVIAQHIPPVFSNSFAQRLDQTSALRVCEARDGQRVLPGHAFVAPGDRHLTIVKDGAGYRCRIDDGPPVNRHKPSVDVLFESVAACAGANAIAAILTGMGRDGAQGLKALYDAGAPTIAQDRDSSVVWGMPGSAVEIGAAGTVLPLPKIAGEIRRCAASRPAGPKVREVANR
ncbi:MAG: chemotaxis response regulator protein-glutamate methylesterase, partial [Steroidobacteraceae bacterium]